MAEWVHTFKGAVLASEYDVASHMNSRMYVSRFDQALDYPSSESTVTLDVTR